MTQNQFEEKVQELEAKANRLRIESEKDDWNAELGLRATKRELSNLRHSYYNSLFK